MPTPVAPHQEFSGDKERPATAVIESGLRSVTKGSHGSGPVCDMPRGIRGYGGAPDPGGFLRVALARCDATVIAMRAAQIGSFNPR
jgi:hypothetical protein